MTQISRLKQRKDFLAAAKGDYNAKNSVVVQALKRSDGDEGIRLGFTATKRIGGAVQRNRAKRRLRAALQILGHDYTHSGYDYVFIARPAAKAKNSLKETTPKEAKWESLLDDVKRALIRLSPKR